MGARMHDSRRTVLFLGAGASRPFGFPMTAEILPEILRRLRGRSLFRRGRGAGPNEAGASTHDELQHLLSRFMPALFEGGAEPPLITDLLSLVDHLLSAGNAPQPDLDLGALDRLRALLERAIAEVLAEPTVPDRADANEDLLRRFVDWMHDRAQEGDCPLSIITTNYDVAIEKRLYARLDVQEIPDLIDFGLSWRAVDSPDAATTQARPSSPLLGLYKLHGSLDWLRCPLCDHIYIDPARTIFRGEGRGKGPEQAARRRATCVCGYRPLRHIIVAPSMVRDVRNPNLLTIWHSALEALRTADEWIVIGYSMPPEDVAIRAMLLRAHRGRERPPRVRLVELGQNEEVENRYRLLFPDLEFEGGGVEGFVSSLFA
jgi:NAD-dependent SIR2 family protein deacetylase